MKPTEIAFPVTQARYPAPGVRSKRALPTSRLLPWTVPWNVPSGSPQTQKPPVGPPSGNVAAHTMPAAPSVTGRPPAPPMSVATQPGHTELTRMPSARSSSANTRVNAFNAAFEVE